jgi:hypothetical protein
MKITMAAIGISSLFVFAGPVDALDWTFTVSNDIGQTATGTFTTNGVAHVVGQTYTISNIAGSHQGFAIGGISNFGGPSQTFQWDGATFDPDINGIEYFYGFFPFTSAMRFYSSAGAGYGTADSWEGYDSSGTLFLSGNVTNTSLTPASPSPSSAPGPLPFFGAAAAFSWSRRLRRRVSSRPQRLETPAPSATLAL